jgi:RNA polymerase sporulation-specific sigma factor
MIFRNYNDFEIINLIKRGNDEAFELMVDKYKYLIAKKIGSFNLAYQYDDCFQESLMILYKSVIKFDESFNKSFTRFFEGNLINCLISIKRRLNRYGTFINEKLPVLYDDVIHEDKEIYIRECEIKTALEQLSSFERQVFHCKIIKKMSVQQSAYELNCDDKKIYNAIDRIRKKIKMQLLL